MALGVELLLQLPISSLWLIGLAIGIDFILDGASFVALGVALKGIPTTLWRVLERHGRYRSRPGWSAAAM